MTGVSWDSASSLAVFTGDTGAFDGNYPVANLGDVRRISKVTRVAPAGGSVAFHFVWAAAQTVQFVGLLNHTIPATASMRAILYQNANLTTSLYDTGTVSVWPSGGPVSGYPSNRPVILPNSVQPRSGSILITGLAAPIDLGGVELAKWWDWPLAPGHDFGFDGRAGEIEFLGAGAEPAVGGAPRVMNGQISHLALATAATVGLDFQAAQGRAKPFVYVQDSADPASWARTCMVCTNVEVPPSVGALYRHDTFQFRFREHLR